MDNGTCMVCGAYNAMLSTDYDDGVETLVCRDCGFRDFVRVAPSTLEASDDNSEAESDAEVERLSATAAGYYYDVQDEPEESQEEIYRQIADERRAEAANERALYGERWDWCETDDGYEF